MQRLRGRSESEALAKIKKGASEVAFGEQLAGSEVNPAPMHVKREGGKMEEISKRGPAAAAGIDNKQS